MKIQLAYGKKGLLVQLPKTNVVKVMAMKETSIEPDPYIALTKTLLQPVGIERTLFDMAKEKKSACILMCDITRPVPNKIILPPILKTLHAAGLDHDHILLLIATGMHRPNLDEELVELVGKDIARNYRVENHYSRDQVSHGHLGKTSRGTDVWIDQRYLDADLKMATGFIEPHLMAGFSGGRKLIVPGIAGMETMKSMHGPHLLAHPNAREGVIFGNPFHEEALEIAKMAGVDFIVNVSLDEKRNITGIFSGDLEKAHEQGVSFVRDCVRDTVPEPVDVVLTTGGGYPLDTTWYQAIKGLTAAMPVVKEGGTIIIASECSRGLGSEDFQKLVHEYGDLELFMTRIMSGEVFVPDQWQLQEYVKVARKAKVFVVSDGMTKLQKERAFLDWAPSVEEAFQSMEKKYGPEFTTAVIPKGPYILADIE
ncbi:nickel-dependent lactate racemase [candidate division KSB1 bacterium]|nr:nickel-dependent lactate racemase [candidate division KSB1 bacterium]